MLFKRREFFGTIGAAGISAGGAVAGNAQGAAHAPLRITGLKVTPIALPDPPLLAYGGCHGPYFLRNLVQLETDGKIVGVGETKGGESTTRVLEKMRERIVGQNAFAYRAFAKEIYDASPAAYAAIELACLDACGKATGRRLCELLGGPVRQEIDVAAYLFYRYAADNPTVLEDPRIADARGRGDRALDDYGEVRTPEAMVRLAQRFQKEFGFRIFKLKAGVFEPRVELETMRLMNQAFEGRSPLRIDPNGRWRTETAIAAGKELKAVNLEYYEDPVRGQAAMAEVRKATGLAMSTNMCVTRFEHVREALRAEPIDVVLCDSHYWGGIVGCQDLGRICDIAGWKMSQHSNNHAGVTMAAMINVGCVCPQLTIASDTHYPWLPPRSDILQGGKLRIQNGRMSLPTGPGLGVALDEDQVARAHEAYRKSGMRERDDAAMMRRFIPGWQNTPY